jgi:hypothetical protein
MWWTIGAILSVVTIPSTIFVVLALCQARRTNKEKVSKAKEKGAEKKTDTKEAAATAEKKPKAKAPLPRDGMFMILALAVIFVYGLCYIASVCSSTKTCPAAKEASWGEWRTLRLTDEVVPIAWENGAIEGDHRLAPGAEHGRRFLIKSGGGEWHSVGDGDSVTLDPGEPVYFKVNKGEPPLYVTWRWKTK